MSYLHNANRAQFSNPAGITVEYSRDNGATWTDYGATNSQKVNFVSGLGAYFSLGGPSASSNTTTSDQLRITIQPDKCGFYTNLKTILINISTNGNSDCKVKIERSSRGSDTNFTRVIGTYAISGWSDWNSIPLNINAFGGDSTQTGNTGALRFTFTHMTVSSSKNATNILDMMFLGTTSWRYNSNMAKTGHIYNWDYQQNAIFPAQITATAFNGKASSASVIADAAGVNTSLNKLSTGTSTPVDTDYYISQYVNGGTTTTTYHRRPMSALWAYVKGKTDGLYQSKGNYAGSGSAGGSANSAVKLDTSTAGASTQPVYFTGGKPVACTYTLGKSVPSDAKFTDTVYTLPTAGSALGGVKTTSTVTSASGYTACPIIDGVPYYKDTNTTYSLSSFGVNASAAELNYTKGVTSAIQTQLNGKVPTGRKVNGKALSADISLTASDVGAAASSHTHSQYLTSHQDISGKVNKSGDTLTGRLTKAGGGTWLSDRTNVAVFGSASTKDAYNCVVGQKTPNGAWTIGNLASNNNLVFNYTTDENYNNGPNTSTVVYLPNKAGIIALTSQIPTSLPANGGNASTVNGHSVNADVPSGAKFTDTVYTLPTASGSTLGGVKTTSTVTSNSGYTACPIISGVPYYKDTNTTYSLSSFGINASATEINYTKGVTSAIQTQLNGKVPTSRTVNGKALSADISLTASDVGAAASGHTHSYLPLTGGTVSGATTFSNTTASTSTTTGAVKISGGLGVAGSIYGSKVYGAVWNDYAEYRICNEEFLPGQVVCENGDDTLSISAQRLQPGANIVSDTFGFAIGETDEAKCPVAVSGRVLAYPAEPLSSYLPGDPVCAGPRGTVSKMTREEVREYPDRIIGTVSTVPTYETWGENNVPVNGRIWIKVK